VTSLYIAITVALLTFAAGVTGLYLQRLLPEHHTSDRSRDMIASVNALVTLLLALVLGTLVSASYGRFANEKAELETLAAHAIELDMALAQFGPDGEPARAGLKTALTHGYEAFWSDAGNGARATEVGAAVPGLRAMSDLLNTLDAKTPAQKQSLLGAESQLNAIADTRLRMSMQLATTDAWPMLIIIASWALLLFCGYGLLSRMNAMTLAALAFGAFAVASAIFLILELRQPYAGLIRVPSAPLTQAIGVIGK